MEPISISVSVTDGPDHIDSSTASASYIAVAEQLMCGVRQLARSGQVDTATALAFLCAHVLECLLKAAVTTTSAPEVVRAPDVRHDLKRLWELAAKSGIALPVDLPPWASCLHGLHRPPYFLRYATNINVVVLPETTSMVKGLEDIFVLFAERG